MKLFLLILAVVASGGAYGSPPRPTPTFIQPTPAPLATANPEATLDPDVPSIHAYLEAQKAGDLPKALEIAREAYTRRLEQLGPYHNETIEAAVDYAQMREINGDLAGGLEMYKEAHQRSAESLGEKHPATLRFRSYVGGMLMDMGDFIAAKLVMIETLDDLREVAGPTHPLVGKVLQLRVRLWHVLGDLERAMEDAEASVELNTVNLGAGNLQTGHAYIGLGYARRSAGRYAESMAAFEKAMEIYTAIEGSEGVNVGIAHYAISSTALMAGDLELAEEAGYAAVENFERNLPPANANRIISKLSFAGILVATEQYDRAMEILQDAKALADEHLPPKHLIHSLVLRNFGDAYHAMGEDGKALEALGNAVEFHSTLFESDGERSASALIAMGRIESKNGWQDKALEHFERSHSILEEMLGPEHYDTVDSRTWKGIALLRKGEVGASRELVLGSLEHLRGHLIEGLQGLNEGQQGRWLDQREHHYDAALSLASARAGEDLKTIWNALLFRKSITLRLLAGQRGAIEALGDENLTQLYEQLSLKKQRYATLNYEAPKGLDATVREEQLAQLRDEIVDAERAIAKNSALYAREQALLDVRWADVAKTLAPGTAVVDFYRFEDVTSYSEHYGAFCWRDGALTFEDLGDADEIDRAIENALQLIRETINVGSPSLDPLLEGLYRRLFGALCIEDAKKVIVVPDGGVHLLPLDVLRHNDEALIEQLDLQTLSSVLDLVKARLEDAPSPPVVVAAPDFAGTGEVPKLATSLLEEAQTIAGRLAENALSLARLRGAACLEQLTSFEDLPGTLDEARAITRVIPQDASVYLGAEATAEKLLSSERPLILHVATHGFFLDDCTKAFENTHPLLRSGLAFAEANMATADAYVTAYQASQMDLRGTKLVVLSACDTGKGVVGADGLYGLRRAFEHAGASTVVTSLWEVPDRETAELMELYYRQLRQGEGAITALSKAKQTMRKRVRRRFGEDRPAYWAGFVAVGADAVLAER